MTYAALMYKITVCNLTTLCANAFSPDDANFRVSKSPPPPSRRILSHPMMVNTRHFQPRPVRPFQTLSEGQGMVIGSP